MKKLNRGFNKHYAGLLAFLLLLLGVFTSCKKDDLDNNNEPVAEYGVPSAKYMVIESAKQGNSSGLGKIKI